MQNSCDISFVIINWNTGKLLEDCVKSLLSQEGVTYEVILIDNNSSDSTKEIVKQLDSSVKVILNKENLGYSGAANQGITLSQGMYVSIINPDIILNPDYAFEIIGKLNTQSNLSSATGKLIKYDFKKHSSLNVIDSTGIIVERDLRMIDRGQNSPDLDQFDEQTNVFGVSGAAPIYKREALEDIKIRDEYFDEDFLAYKEDIDLSWRLRLYGWEALYVPAAVGHHGRAVSGTGSRSKRQFIQNRKTQSAFLRKISMRNHYCLLVKNLRSDDILPNFFPILKREIQHLGFCLIFEPKTLAGVGEFFKLLPKMLRKRRLIKKACFEKGRKSQVYFK